MHIHYISYVIHNIIYDNFRYKQKALKKVVSRDMTSCYHNNKNISIPTQNKESLYS